MCLHFLCCKSSVPQRLQGASCPLADKCYVDAPVINDKHFINQSELQPLSANQSRSVGGELRSAADSGHQSRTVDHLHNIDCWTE